MIEVIDAERSFGEGVSLVRAVQGANLTLHRGEVLAVLGASGSGKSTLIKLMAGLLLPSSGSVELAGEDLARMDDAARTALRLHTIGVVFQGDNLLPEFSAIENVTLPLEVGGLDRSAARAVALDAMDRVGVADLADRAVDLMSGGQRQRVGIARAVAGTKEYLLADEPTGSLDSATSRVVFSQLRGLSRSEQSVGVLIATHDPIVFEFADRALTITDGQPREAPVPEQAT